MENTSFETKGSKYTERGNLKSGRVLLGKRKSKGRKVTFASQISLAEVKEKPKNQSSKVWDWIAIRVNALFDNKAYIAIILVLSMWTLFNVDLKNLLVSARFDNVFDVTNTIIFYLFTLEFSLNVCFKSEYIFTFYCLFDFISAASLIPDVPSIWSPILNNFSETADSDDDLLDQGNFVTASSKITKYVRFLSVINIMKIVRVAKIISSTNLIRKAGPVQKRVSIRNKVKKRLSRPDSIRIFEQSTYVKSNIREQRIEYLDGIEIRRSKHDVQRPSFSMIKSTKDNIEEVKRNLKRPSVVSMNNSPLNNNFLEKEVASMRVKMPKLIEMESSEAASEMESEPKLKSTVSTQLQQINQTEEIYERKEFRVRKNLSAKEQEIKEKNLEIQKEANLRLEKTLVAITLNKVVLITMIFIFFFSIFNDEFAKDVLDIATPDSSELCIEYIKTMLKGLYTKQETFENFTNMFEYCYNEQSSGANTIKYISFKGIPFLKEYESEDFPLVRTDTDIEYFLTNFRENLDYLNVKVEVKELGYFTLTLSLADKFFYANLFYLLQSVFISCLLLTFSYLFSKDITLFIISPLDNLFKKINIFFTEEGSLRELSTEKQSEEETIFIESCIKNFLKTLQIVSGKQGLALNSL